MRLFAQFSERLLGLNGHDVSVDSMPLTIRLLTNHISLAIDALRWRASRQVCSGSPRTRGYSAYGCNKRNDSDNFALTSAAANVPTQYYDHYAGGPCLSKGAPVATWRDDGGNRVWSEASL